MSVTRATSPVIAVPLLVGVTVVLATAVGVMAMDYGPPDWQDPRVLSAEATDDGTIELIHESGPVIDVTDASILVYVDGDPLRYQPPIPFTGATGFDGAPSGAFNPSADPVLEPGDRASLVVAGTNSPTLEADATLEIRFVREDTPFAVVKTTVERG